MEGKAFRAADDVSSKDILQDNYLTFFFIDYLETNCKNTYIHTKDNTLTCL